MTQEEKAKRYDEAIEKGKQIQNTPYTAHWDIMKEVAEHLLPELKESEDERIRKELLEHCKNLAEPYIYTGNKCPQIQSWISWLERQGEQNPAFEMKTPEESLGIDSDTYNKIVDECIYGDDKSTWSEDDELHIRELEGLVKRVWVVAEHENDKDTIHKMSDLSFFLKMLKPQLKQEWSEEDEKIKESIITGLEMLKDGASDKSLITLYNKKIDWLKSLKGRVGCEANCTTTKECSEEDEQLINEVAECLRKYARKVQGGNSKVYVLSLADRIESLRPQSQWKPSDEQMLAIETAINVIGKGTLNGGQLTELLEQLKAL